MNLISDRKPKVKSHFGLALLFAFLNFACSKPRPAYIEAIPDISEYSYQTIHDWNGLVNDTLVAQTWYDPSDNEALIRQVGSVLDLGNGNVWMSDQLNGSILEFDQQGSFIRNVFSEGRGPSEFVRPISMAVNPNAGSSDVYILDDRQNMVSRVSSDGVEIRRYFFKEMPFMFHGNKLSVLGENEFVWPTFNHDYALSSRDTLDRIVNHIIKPIIPRGSHPLTLNTLEYHFDGETFLHAYQGIPLIFVNTGDQKFVLNLEPDKNLEQIGIPLSQLPSNDSSVAVPALIRGVVLFDNHIIVVSKISLYRIPLDRKKPITVSSLMDEGGQSIAFHLAYITGQSIYMSNQRSGIVYRMRL